MNESSKECLIPTRPILPLKYFVLLPRCQVYPACILINFPETENIVHVAFCEFDLLKIETHAEDK